MQDTDIEGMAPKDAAAYVLAFITTAKQTEREIARLAEETAVWSRRVALAREKGETALADQAQARLAELEGKRAALDGELAELRAKVTTLKQKLLRLRSLPQKSVDADLLLAQLEMLAGKKDGLAEAMKREEAGAKLDELKRKMGGTGSGG